MRVMRTAGICVAVALAIGALVASGASALPYTPEFKQCVKAAKSGKKYIGKYDNATCTKAASEKEIEEGKKNKYEAVEAAEVSFTGKAGAATLNATSESGEAVVVKCKKGTVSGKVLDSEALGAFKVKYEDCETTKKVKCGSAGVIESGRERPELVFLNEAETEFGVLVTQVEGGFVMGEPFQCGTATIDVESDVIGKIAANGKELTITLAVSSGKQDPRAFYLEGNFAGEEFLRADGTEATLSVVLSKMKVPGIVIFP